MKYIVGYKFLIDGDLLAEIENYDSDSDSDSDSGSDSGSGSDDSDTESESSDSSLESDSEPKTKTLKSSVEEFLKNMCKRLKCSYHLDTEADFFLIGEKAAYADSACNKYQKWTKKDDEKFEDSETGLNDFLWKHAVSKNCELWPIE